MFAFLGYQAQGYESEKLELVMKQVLFNLEHGLDLL